MPTVPRISVVIPSHNRPQLLTEAVASVVAQSYGEWEIIIVDDGSTPPVNLPTLQAMAPGRIHGIRHPVARGGPAAKNTGIEACHGDILAFLDDDDLYAPEYLERALAVLGDHPEIDVVFMGVGHFDVGGAAAQQIHDHAIATVLREVGVRRRMGDLHLFDGDILAALLRRIPMAFQRPVVRQNALARIGLYRSDCFLWDCDWTLRATMAFRTALLNVPLYLQRMGGQQYCSRADNKKRLILSNVEIKEFLLAYARRLADYQRLPLLRDAAATACFDAAWYYLHQGQRAEASAYWWRSMHHRPTLSRCSFIARLFIGHAKVLRKTVLSVHGIPKSQSHLEA